MSEVFKQNSRNLIISTLAILCAHFLGIGVILYWFAGLLVVPAIAIWFQFKFTIGNFVSRLCIAFSPWVILCLIGIMQTSKIEHSGQRIMDMLYYQMPLYSVVAGSGLLVIRFFIQKIRAQN